MTARDHVPPTNNVILGERFLLAERIGVGGFSDVWRAQDLVLDRPVAVKLLHASFTGHEETLQRFRAEARHAGSLSHQNIARVYDYGDPGPRHPPYLVMELIAGNSLASVLHTSGALDAATTMDIVAQVAAGLQAAHQAGLVHRDIKPANLLLSTAGVVKITDFGISHAAGSAPMTSTGMIIGTPAYLAPERAAGAQATPASDLYALGAVGYECLTGTPPFAGTGIEVALAHRDRAFPPLPPSVPAPVADLVTRLTAKNPADRPSAAAEVALVATNLRDQLRGDRSPAGQTAPDPVPPPTQLLPQLPPLPQPPPVRRRRRPARLGVLAGTAAVLVGIIAVSLAALASHHGSSSSPPPKASATATGVYVDSQAYLGMPVDVVVGELQRLHLIVRVRWVKTTAEPRGRVVAIRPVGRIATGSLITVIGARKDNHHDHGHDHGDGGGGGDNGSGGGGN